jgi:hypothetical protein
MEFMNKLTILLLLAVIPSFVYGSHQPKVTAVIKNHSAQAIDVTVTVEDLKGTTKPFENTVTVDGWADTKLSIPEFKRGVSDIKISIKDIGDVHYTLKSSAKKDLVGKREYSFVFPSEQFESD